MGYQQKGPFVPYIGTWLKGDGSELFKTVYNNFVYLPQDNAAVVGKNPLTNPDAFGRAIVWPELFAVTSCQLAAAGRGTHGWDVYFCCLAQPMSLRPPQSVRGRTRRSRGESHC